MNADVGTRNAEQKDHAKMGIVEEEADESAFWLDLMVAITVASIRTARGGGVSAPRSAFRVPRSP